MLARVYAMAFPSVCMSVCHTRALYQNGQMFCRNSFTTDSPIILIFRHRGSLLNSDSFIPNEYKGVRKLSDFRPISRCILETVRDTAIVAIEVE